MSARIKIAYGDHPQQFGHLYLPTGPTDTSTPVVMVIHGGFWNGRYGSNLGTRFARAIAGAGAVAWNVEYRRVGAGGHWPEMQSDVTAALDVVSGAVQRHAPVGVDDVRLVGHSAGGHLAVWLGGETGTKVRPSRIVSQAGVLDVEAVDASGRANPALEALMQVRYADHPKLYRDASPAARVPIGIPTICVHGTDDVQVSRTQSERYVEGARAAGDDARLTLVPGEDHFAFLNPDSRSWALSLDAVLGRGAAE